MKNRFILCDCAPGDWGKSMTLKKLIDLFETNNDFERKAKKKGKNDKSDFWCVFQSIKSNQIIIIQTEGDYDTSFGQTMEFLKENSFDLLVCASKCENSNAYSIVDRISSVFDLEIIRFRNYHCANDDKLRQELLNEQMAQSLYNLIMQLLENS